MEEVQIVIGFDSQYRYLVHGENGGSMIGPMPKEIADHIAACLEACRWRPIEKPTLEEQAPILVTDGKACTTAVFQHGEWWGRREDNSFHRLPFKPTHYRPIGPLPE